MIELVSESKEELSEYIVVAYNELSYNCQTRVGDEYWPHYVLGNQSHGEGCLYSEQLSDGWEECEPNDEEIVISTPGVTVPDWCGSCSIEWQLLKKEGDDGETEYLEVGLVLRSDDKSTAAWYKWYDSGFADIDPDEEEDEFADMVENLAEEDDDRWEGESYFPDDDDEVDGDE